MSNPFTNNGTRFYIASALPLTLTIAGYDLAIFTQIIGVRSIGEIGNTHEAIDFNTIGNIRYNKKMGKAALSIPIELINLAGAGQSMINALVNTNAAAAFKIVATDNTTYYFTAECSSNLATRGDSSGVTSRKLILNVNSELIEF